MAIKSGLGGLSLRSKILLMILPVSLVSMGLAAWVSYSTARQALTRQADERVTAIRASKKAQLEAYFRELRGTFAAFSNDIGVAAAARGFTDGLDQLGRQKLDAERMKALARFYRDDFVPKLDKVPGFEDVGAEQLIPHSDKTAEAQSLFIVENPNKPGERSKLLDSPVSNPYTLAHYTYHPWLSELVERLKLYDLYLISDKGQVVYSYQKEPDFGTNLAEGPYAPSNLGRLFRQVLSEHHSGLVTIADFDFYATSLGAPAAFIATPIYSNFKLAGVLVGQFSVGQIDRTLNGDRNWEADGLGKTGFVYATGPAQRLRNDHRIFVEHRAEFLARAREQGYRPADLEAIVRDNTAVLRYRMDTEGVRRALLGQTGTVVSPNSQGNESLQAYAPLEIPDLKWALNASIEVGEILAPLETLERSGLIVAGILTLLTVLFAMWVAARFMRPINDLMAGSEAIKAGRTDVTIEHHGHDEFGKLADSFNTMASAIRQRDAIIEAKNEAYGGVLNRVFPALVANRLRAGEEQIIDTMPDVTLIFASVVGFVQATEGKDGAESARLLTEIIDRIDRLAEHHGLERIKNIGEHYRAACGLTVPRLDHAARTVEFAYAFADEIRLIARERHLTLETSAAIASGPVHAGIVGNSRFVYDVWGKPLNIVQTLIQATETNEIRITDEVFRHLAADNGFEPRPVVHTRTFGDIASFGRAADAPDAEVHVIAAPPTPPATGPVAVSEA